MTLAQAHALVPGSTLVGPGSLELLRVHSDTRTLCPGDLFVALRGEQFDGNDFLAQARAQGAVAALAERGLSAEMPGLRVPDTLLAVQQLAQGWRARFHLPLIAVVGSNGKTTVTQMLASMLRAWCGQAALATAGNLNNHIGVPLTLLRLHQDDEAWHRVAVLELGMNHPGEIAALARLCAPTVAVINNAQREHQEFMATVDAVAQENGQVLTALAPSGTAVLPLGDAYFALWRELAGPRRVLSFGLDAAADVSAQAVWRASSGLWAIELQTPQGRMGTQLLQAGRHNLHNALAASAAALAAGVPLAAVAQGLADFRPVSGRSQSLSLSIRGQAVTLIDDSYNANPDSVLAAIEVLAQQPGPRWLLLGDMGEVGSEGPRFHAEVGAAARQQGIERFWTVGSLSEHAEGHRHFATVDDLLAACTTAWIDPVASSADRAPPRTVLVKGSRFMKMERVVAALQAQGELETTGGGDAA